ncbi:hypothetical protein [Roseovarius sp.]|uniref:hypothetical protein n=1 Tax=Roseovarius sp. TaxID=1486281 RepID=UPI003D1512B6
MLWTHIELESWVFGLSFGVTYCLHVGPLKLEWVPKSGQLYRDFSRIKSRKGGNDA